MKDLMESIMSIDHSANNKLNEAIRRKQEAIEKINQKKIKMAKEIEEYANAHLDTFEKSEKLSAQDSMLAIKNNSDEEQERLYNLYNKNKDVWINTIVSNIIEK